MSADSSEAGFMLVELLVSFAILSLVVITGLQLLSNSASRTNSVEQRRQQAETLRAAVAGYTSGQVGSGDVTFEVRNLTSEELAWSRMKPVLVRATLGGAILETIVLADVTGQ